MGQALKNSDHNATGRRPSKVLRQSNIQLVNLGTYTQSAPPRVPVSHQNQPSAKLVALQRTHSEYVKLESQPFGTKAATNDTAFRQSGSESQQQHSSPKNQLTVIILSSLAIGSLVGYQWSSLLNLTAVASNNAQTERVVEAATPELVVKSATSVTAKPTNATRAAFAAPALSQTQMDAAIDREQQYRLEEKEFLSQIDWLKNQNNVLLSERDALNAESLDQNRELLALELEVVALQSQSVPQTETRVIYNFVNTPIGSSTSVQFGGLNAQYNEDALEDSDEHISNRAEQQRAQYNEEGQLIYDLESGKYLEGYVENNQESDITSSPTVNSTQYSGNEDESYETVNAELINELQAVRLRQFEAGLLDYDHASGTFVQKDFGGGNNEGISYPPIPTE